MATNVKTRSALKDLVANGNAARDNNIQDDDKHELAQFVTCNNCKSRVLFACTSINKPYDEVKRSGAAYICKICRLETKFESKLAALNQLAHALKDENEALEKELTSTKAELETTKNEVKGLQAIVSNILPEEESEDKSKGNSGKDEMQATKKKSYLAAAAVGLGANKLVTADMCAAIVTKTIEDINNRKQNIVVYNVPEGKQELSDENKRNHDLLHVKNVLQQLEVSKEIQALRCFRLGRKDDQSSRSRPILVKLRTEEDRDLILRKAFRCRDYVLQGGEKQVAISPDRTREEREEQKNLLKELQERLKKGEKDWVLRNGRLIKKKTEQAAVVDAPQ